MKQFLLKSVLFTIIFCIGISITVILLKARSITSSTTDSNPTSIYANNWDTLTAAKWNTVVDKIQRKEMDINDTTTQFNTNCERRRKRDTGENFIVTRIQAWTLRRKDNQAAWRNVRYTNKKIAQLYNLVSTTRAYQSNSRTIGSLQYRCP